MRGTVRITFHIHILRIHSHALALFSQKIFMIIQRKKIKMWYQKFFHDKINNNIQFCRYNEMPLVPDGMQSVGPVTFSWNTFVKRYPKEKSNR